MSIEHRYIGFKHYMIKLFLKYLLSIGCLLLLGNQQVYAYSSNSDNESAKKNASYTSHESLENTKVLLFDSNSSDQRKQHVICEDKVEEEEERKGSEDFFEKDYLSTSLALTFSERSFLLFSKERLTPHPYFYYFTSYKLYLRFEVFRI